MEAIAGFGIMICLVAFIAGIIGLIKPAWIKAASRKTGGFILAGSILASGVFGAFLPEPPPPKPEAGADAKAEKQKSEAKPAATGKPSEDRATPIEVSQIRFIAMNYVYCAGDVRNLESVARRVQSDSATMADFYSSVTNAQRACEKADKEYDAVLEDLSFPTEPAIEKAAREGVLACQQAVRFHGKAMKLTITQFDGDTSLKTNQAIKDLLAKIGSEETICEMQMAATAEEIGMDADFLESISLTMPTQKK